MSYYLMRYFRSLGDFRRRIAVILVLSLFSVLLQAALPWTGKIMIDELLPRKDLRLLLWGCVALLVIGICGAVISLVQDYLESRMLGLFVTAIRRRMMKHLQTLALDRIQDLKVGGIITRLQADSEAMAGLLNGAVLTPFSAGLMFVLGMGSLLYLNWLVTLSCLGFCATIIGLAYCTFRIFRPIQKTIRAEMAQLGARLTESFSGAQVVRVFRREPTEVLNYSREAHLLWRKSFHVQVLNLFAHRAVWIVYWCLTVTIWAVGGWQILKRNMRVGDLVAFIAFADWLFRPVFMLMRSLGQIQVGLAGVERIIDLLDEKRSMPDRPGALPVHAPERGLAFDNVTFDYPNGARALTGVSVTFVAGQVTALVGSSGAGKSTMVNLLLRLYDVTAGAVRLDGTDIRDFSLRDYRGLFSLVPQEIFLFDGTIRDNIAYGRMGAGPEEIEAAACAAHCHEFIIRLKHGYETFVGERGVRLSMGQKQRVALARSILADPRFLVLDEATSSLDSESERLIQDALRTVFRGRTTIVIAHRLSTVLDADKIVALDKGRAVEEGRHEELLARKGRYWELYTRQMEKAERMRSVLDWNAEPGVENS